MKKIIIATIFLFLLSSKLYAQISKENITTLRTYEKELIKLDSIAINGSTEMDRKNATHGFIKTLVKALKTPNSYEFSFDSLKTIMITTDPKDKFRIFTWHIPQDDNSIRFYGTIQMNTTDIKLYPLSDYSEFFKNDIRDTITDNKHWVGAQYYQIIPPKTDKEPYLLLGWRATKTTAARIIEPIYFTDDKVIMGSAKMFQYEEKMWRNRFVHEYSRKASVYLRYNYEKNWFVFDHLVPMEVREKQDINTDDPNIYYSILVPDLTYDALALNKKGKWEYKKDVDAKNVESAMDSKYQDPKKLAEKAEIDAMK